MNTYAKPTFKVERFLADVRVATSACIRTFVGIENVLYEQDIDCLATTSAEGVFNATISCAMTATKVITTTTTYYFRDAVAAINYLAGSGSASTSSGSYTLSAGTYIVWYDSNGKVHAGPVDYESSELYTNSY